MHVLWTIDLDCCRHFSVRVGNIVFLNQIKMIKATELRCLKLKSLLYGCTVCPLMNLQLAYYVQFM